MSLPTWSEGTALPELDVPFDRTTIIATAIASQDFEDVHHDPGAAERRGLPDIFISINATNGFVDRYVTDWAGPHARIAKASLRLGVPHHPGDVLRLRGTVVEVGGGTTVEVVGSNERGVHVTAKVTVVEAAR